MDQFSVSYAWQIILFRSSSAGLSSHTSATAAGRPIAATRSRTYTAPGSSGLLEAKRRGDGADQVDGRDAVRPRQQRRTDQPIAPFQLAPRVSAVAGHAVAQSRVVRLGDDARVPARHFVGCETVLGLQGSG